MSLALVMPRTSVPADGPDPSKIQPSDFIAPHVCTGAVSGGVLYFPSTTTMGSSGLLTQHGLVVGGGAGAGPSAIAVGATGTVLIGNTNADPSFSASPSVTAFTLPATTSSVTGVVFKGASRFLHNFTPATADGSNTFLGVNAGNFTMSPSGGPSTRASYNTAVGINALTTLTTGSYNVGVGANALSLATSAIGCIGIGSDALTNLLTGTDNIAIGWDCQHSLTTGLRNVAIGTDALFHNNGDNNVAIGANALLGTSTGSNNLGLGTNALSSNTGGVYNLALGTDAVASAVGVSYNLGIGAAALYKSTGGSNIAIGFTAMHENTSGVNNTVIGWQGLFSNNGSGNVILGYNAAVQQTALSNGLIVDNQDRGSAANELTKALIVGHFDAAPANQTLVFNSAVAVTQLGARAAGDKYVVIDATGNLHISAIGPAS